MSEIMFALGVFKRVGADLTCALLVSLATETVAYYVVAPSGLSVDLILRYVAISCSVACTVTNLAERVSAWSARASGRIEWRTDVWLSLSESRQFGRNTCCIANPKFRCRYEAYLGLSALV